MNLFIIPPPNVMTSLEIIYSILIIATFVCYFKKWKNPSKHEELVKRINSWWVIILALTVFFLLGVKASVAMIAIISVLALKEFINIMPLRASDRKTILWTFITIPIQYYWVMTEWYGMFIIFIPVYMFLLYSMRLVITGETQGFINSASTLHWGVMLTVFAISHMGYLLMLPLSRGNMDGQGLGLLLFLIFITQFNDVLQYIWGKSIGRRKVIPKVSPNKTLEGLLGGVFSTTIIASFLAPLLTPMDQIHGAIAGLLIGVSGFFGDVTMSAVKRDLGIKDTSKLIPGHGGVLDRIDSLTYSAPLFFHYIRFYYY